MPGQKPKDDEIRLSTSEYLHQQRLLSAAQRLENAALEVVVRYGSLIQARGLEEALDGLNRARRPIHNDIGRRYGWDDA